MTAPKPPRHGTYARYRGDARRSVTPCHCQRCRDAYNRYRKRRELYGPYSFDPAPVAEHIRHLLGNETTTLVSIARAAGVHHTVLHKILTGQRKTVFAETRARILAVTAAPDDHAKVDATGSIRRLRALIAAGHSVAVLRENSGVNKQTLTALITGAQPRVTLGIARNIANMYERLSMAVGDSALSRGRAAREGWPPPLAWTDIDDPDEQPTGWHRPERCSPAELAEDAEFIMRTTGVGVTQAAARIGVPHSAVSAALKQVAA